MSTDYTSYSPITAGWTEDPSSMKDEDGGDTLWLPTRPAGRKHNPDCGYLTYDGRVLLDENNRAIKSYPGAPLTLHSKVPGYFLCGLRRYFGMTHSE